MLPDLLVWLALAVTAFGALFGFAGIYMRLAGPNERALSLPDDYASVFLTSLFIALAFGTLLWPSLLPAFYVVTGLMGPTSQSAKFAIVFIFSTRNSSSVWALDAGV
jgi:hypothetical protein